MSTQNDYATLYEALIDRWARTLRSGDYKQGRDALYNPKKRSYCCLGVLCDLVPSSKMQQTNDEFIEFVVSLGGEVDADEAILPSPLARLFGMDGTKEANPHVPPSVVREAKLNANRLATLNDNENSFGIIADVIEESYKGEWAREKAQESGVQDVLDDLVEEGFFDSEMPSAS